MSSRKQKLHAFTLARADERTFSAFLGARNTLISARAISRLICDQDLEDGPAQAIYAVDELLAKLHDQLEAVGTHWPAGPTEEAQAGRSA